MFLLPIFSEKPEKFEEWFQHKVQKSLDEIENASGIPVSENTKECILENERKMYGIRWPFNRAVGWIHITKAVGGFAFLVAVASNSKRREPKRSYIPLALHEQPNNGKYISFSSCSNTSDVIQRFDSVFNEVIKYNRCFKGCYVDASMIIDNAEFINWNALLEK